jgi:voltage-gated potassium channel
LAEDYILQTHELTKEFVGFVAVRDINLKVRSRDVGQGTVIIRKGDPGDTMYFLVSGEATVQLAEPVVLRPGSFFGEMALLFGAPRSATVVATEPSVLLVLDIADLRELAGRRPELVDLIEAEARRRSTENAKAAASAIPINADEGGFHETRQ